MSSATGRKRPREPRDHALAIDRAVFGRTDTIHWSSTGSGKTEQYVALVAAQIQHHYALAIRRQLDAQRSSVKEYADTNRLPYDRTSKVLRGAAVMNFEDIVRAEILLGGGVLNIDVSAKIAATIQQGRQALDAGDSPHG